MTLRVAVAGASGYAGGEVLRILGAHPEVALGTLTAATAAGARIGDRHPHLTSLAERTFVQTSPEALAGHDVVFLALPHGQSGAIAAALPPEILVIDLGADHRLVSADDWSAYYGSVHAGTWPYGMPELLRAEPTAAGTEYTKQRELLIGATRIAVPGCNVTAVTLGLQPGIAAGLLDGRDIVAVLANGYSGAGRAAKPHLLAAEALGSAAPYAVGGVHRHIPEIAQNLRLAGAPEVTISFTPTLVPMSRGILATATARLAPGAGDVDEARLRLAWEQAYAGEPFVHLLPPGQWPTTAMTLGANLAMVQVAFDRRAGRAVTTTAIDNLVKGTAGAAVQSMNIALGLPQTLGLTQDGVAP